MKILNLKLKNAKDSNVFIANTDMGEYELFSDVIVKFRITKGEIDKENFFSCVEESAEKIAFNLAVKYISSKLKTEKQIKDYLYKHSFKKQTIDSVLEKLKEYGVINDKAFMESYVRSNPYFSKNKLKQKLTSAGVKKEELAVGLEDVDEFESCFYNAKKFLKNKVLDKQTREKLIRRLNYLGYNWDTINSTLNKLNFKDFE